jgi:hypothetical protein
MGGNSSINLKQFIPNKVSKLFLLKIVFYVLVLGVLFYILFTTSSAKSLKEPVFDEIQNIKIVE